MLRCLRCLGLGLWVLLSSGAALADSDGTGEPWSGWRGAGHQGRTEASLPVHWSAEENLTWKTRIPGVGYSSPVVADDLVVVTTVYPRARGERWKAAAEGLSLVLVLVLAVAGGQLLVGVCDRRGGALGLPPRASFLAGCLAITLGWALLAPGAFDYPRCEIRSWLGSIVLLGLCLLLSELGSRARSPWRLGVALVGWTVAGFALWQVPYRDHAFADGLASKKTATVLTLVSVPLAVGWTAALRWLRARPWVRRRAWARRRGLWWALAVLAAAAGTSQLVFLAARWGPVTGVKDPSKGILLAIPFLAILGQIALTGPQMRPFRRATTVGPLARRNLLRVVGVLVLGVGGVAGITILAIARSQYLSYHLSDPRWNPLLGSWTPLLVVLVFAVAVGERWRRLGMGLATAGEDRPTSLRPRLAAPSLGLGLLVFVASTWLTGWQVQTRALVATDLDSGEIRWTLEAIDGPKGTFHKSNSPASSTPVVGDETIYAFFGDGGVVAVDFEGRLEWIRHDVRFHSQYGAGSSPILVDDLLILVLGMSEQPYILALDAHTGVDRWRHPMLGEPVVSGTSRTPLVETLGGRATLLVWGFEGLSGYDVESGDLRWHYSLGDTLGDLVASPVADGRRLILSGPSYTLALDKTRLGEPEPPVLWETRVGGPNVASPVLAGGLVFLVKDNGIASCLDTGDGTVRWRMRLGGKHYASPVAAGSGVYFTSTTGLTTVVATSANQEVLAKNPLGEGVFASLAATDRALLVRGERHLFRIDTPSREPGETADARLGKLGQRRGGR